MGMSVFIKKEDRDLLKAVFNFAKTREKKLYIVGGYLRDIMLKRQRPDPDIDFCLKKGAISFGRALSKKLQAGFVVLDKEHGAARLVKKFPDKTCTLDFTDFRGKTLQEDLLHRDFTVNTLAMELGKDELIDLYGARRDLQAKIIRLSHKAAFDEDPLRILRAFSFSCMLAFKIDPATLKEARKKKNKLRQVSFERVREELFKILDSPDSYRCFQELDRSGILKIIFPEFNPMRGMYQGPYHHLDVWAHTLETLKQIEKVIREKKNNREIRDYLDEAISAQRRRASLMKLAALLHDIGKPPARRRKEGKIIFHGHERLGAAMAEAIARRLKLSNDELALLKGIVFWHLRPGYLADSPVLSARAKFRYFRDTRNEAVSTLLVSLADQRATRGPLTTRASRLNHEKLVALLLREYFRAKKIKPRPRLINGDDLIKEFKLEPSPLFGKILREVEESRAIGKIKTREQALRLARRFVK
jgi:putative nucleotidyltransferase with HDIG domain